MEAADVGKLLLGASMFTGAKGEGSGGPGKRGGGGGRRVWRLT